jgi:hypothetical protein
MRGAVMAACSDEHHHSRSESGAAEGSYTDLGVWESVIGGGANPGVGEWRHVAVLGFPDIHSRGCAVQRKRLVIETWPSHSWTSDRHGAERTSRERRRTPSGSCPPCVVHDGSSPGDRPVRSARHHRRPQQKHLHRKATLRFAPTPPYRRYARRLQGGVVMWTLFGSG